MSREEIETGLAKILHGWRFNLGDNFTWENEHQWAKDECLEDARTILKFEDSQGVVIKVDGEETLGALGSTREQDRIAEKLYIPIRLDRIQDGDLIQFAMVLQLLFKSLGYTAVEPLIGDE